MYGLINNTFRKFVAKTYGDDCWNSVQMRTELDEDCFLSFRKQADDSTYALVGAASEILEIPGALLLEQYGRYWVDNVAKVQFSQIMEVTGKDFVGFVNNLDGMHKGISGTFLGYSPPKFHLEKHDEAYYRLSYRSVRAGLTPFVSGLLQGLGSHFKTSIEIKSIDTVQSDEGEYSEFLLELTSHT